MRTYAMEVIGTFFFTLAVCFATFTGYPLSAAFILMSVVYLGLHVSGAHYNPAVSFTFFLRNKLRLEELGLYIVSQCVGALLAVWFFGIMTNTIYSPEFPSELPMWITFTMETLLTYIFCITILTVVLLERYRNTPIQGMVIGLTWFAIASTPLGGLFNPAIAGAALLVNTLYQAPFTGFMAFSVYMIAPFVAGAIAASVYAFLNESSIHRA